MFEEGKYTLLTIIEILKSITNMNNCSMVELSTDNMYDLCLIFMAINIPSPRELELEI